MAVSKCQCEIIREKNGVFLSDKSSNGTWVNGNKVGKGKMWPLEHNSEICFPIIFLHMIFLKSDPLSEVTTKLPPLKYHTYHPTRGGGGMPSPVVRASHIHTYKHTKRRRRKRKRRWRKSTRSSWRRMSSAEYITSLDGEAEEEGGTSCLPSPWPSLLLVCAACDPGRGDHTYSTMCLDEAQYNI